jgi:pyruvate formate lyase activating enzyme
VSGKKAEFWEPYRGMVRCNLCSHRCPIPEGKTGICGVRQNRDNTLYALSYEKPAAIAVDPIEKKPLFHFHPGTSVLSFGGVGCNFRCLHCQNWDISQAGLSFPYLKRVPVEDIPGLVKKRRSKGVAWTYNEPTIWYEYTYDASKLVKKEGMYSVYVTNGYMEEEPMKELRKYVDAMNIDVKAFTEEFYRKIVGAKLQPVLDHVVAAKELGYHVELTYLIIPGKNDNLDEIKSFSEWVANEVGVETPVHFSRFHPDYKMTNVRPTPYRTMMDAYETAKEAGLDYVYLGNMVTDKENTYCPKCGELLVERQGFGITKYHIKNGKCPKCGHTIHGVGL